MRSRNAFIVSSESSGQVPATEDDVVVWEKACQRLEHVGLPLTEAKHILTTLQPRLVASQTAAFVAARIQCKHCGMGLRVKGYQQGLQSR